MPAGVGDLSPAGAGQLLLGVAAPGGCRPEAGALPPQHLPLYTGQIQSRASNQPSRSLKLYNPRL